MLAGAVPLQAADVTVEPYTNLAPTSVTLNGTVNPNDPDAGADYIFSYGTTNTYGTDVSGTVPASETPEPVNAPLTGLSPSTTYHYQLCATNALGPVVGTTCSADQTFTTPDKPAATTGSASSVTNTSATLGGSVDPNGASTSYSFSYGTTSGSYTNQTTAGDAGSGTSSTPVSAPISGLTGNTRYFFTLCATNPFGTTCGGEASFTTPDAPTAVTGAATGVSTNGATLAGTVNPNGANVTQTYFDYGTSTAYGSQATASPGPGSGRAAQNVSATLNGGLASGQVFHYRLCATNTFGTRCGADQQFTTNSPPTAALVADKAGGPTPLTVTFDGSGSSDPGGSIDTWTLNFGDGKPDATGHGTPGATISHTYTAACNCVATLTVTDNQGATAHVTVGIHVTANQAPVARLSASRTSGTAPVDVTFDGSGSADPDGIPLKSWSLDFGDGTSTAGTGPVPSTIGPHSYASAGSYNAKLTVTDSSDASASTTVAITVNAPPALSIADATVTEGQTANFVITLSAVSTHDIAVDYTTADGTAGSGDYTLAQGTFTIPAGSCGPTTTGCVIPVVTADDNVYETDETFSVVLSNVQAATIARGTATGTIHDNDAAPVLMIKSSARLEGNAGSSATTAQTWANRGSVTVADASGLVVDPRQPFWVITPGSRASGPSPFSGFSGPYSFSGKTGNTLTGVSPAGSVGTGQLVFQPVPITFDVLLCDAASPGTNPDQCIRTTSGRPTTIQYTTFDGVSDSSGHTPVKSGQDYVAECSVIRVSGASCDGPVSPPITIPAGDATATVDASVIPNLVSQDTTRHFTLQLVSAVGASIRWGLGSGIIIDDDAPPGSLLPVATTNPATSITSTAAAVSGVVNPQGLPTTAFIQYGKTLAYGSTTPVANLPADFNDHGLNFGLSGLAPGTTYHFQVVAQHADNGTGYGIDRTFTTLSPPPPPPPPPQPQPQPQPQPDPIKVQSTELKVKVKTRSATVSPKGILLLPFTCNGTAARRCTISVYIDSSSAHFYSGKIVVPAGQTRVLKIKLSRSALKLLVRKKRLRVDVSYSYSNGHGDVTYDDTAVTLKAPATPKPKPHTAAAKHK